MRTTDSSCFDLQVELIVNPSDEVIPKLRAEYGLERLDFVFMDHWKKCYAPDLQVTSLILHLVVELNFANRADSPNDFVNPFKKEKYKGNICLFNTSVDLSKQVSCSLLPPSCWRTQASWGRAP